MTQADLRKVKIIIFRINSDPVKIPKKIRAGSPIYDLFANPMKSIEHFCPFTIFICPKTSVSCPGARIKSCRILVRCRYFFFRKVNWLLSENFLKRLSNNKMYSKRKRFSVMLIRLLILLQA